MSERSVCDVVVVGLGAMGSAACFALAKRGVAVRGIDRFDVVHEQGSSHGRTRIFRVAYFEHPDYVPLLQEARRLWIEIGERAGPLLFHPTGGVWMGRESGALVKGSADAARRHALTHEVLSAGEVSARWPRLAMPDGFTAFHEADAGTIFPERAVESFCSRAKDAGVILHTDERVRSWQRRGNTIEVETEKRSIAAERLIVAAGPWSHEMLAGLDLPLTVTRQPSAWFEANDPDALGPSSLPCWALERHDESFFYGFPLFSRQDGLKVSLHEVLEPTKPDSVDRTVRPEEIALLKDAIDRALPGAAGDLIRAGICLYTNTPDGHFIIDRHPDHDNVVFACGFSGHGFKFAPVIGEILTDLAMGGGTHYPIDFLRLDRFSRR